MFQNKKNILFLLLATVLFVPLSCKKDGVSTVNTPVLDERQQAIKDFEQLYSQSDVSASELGWTGSVATCSAGTVAAGVNDKVLARINFYRKIVGLPATCTHDATLGTAAQGAAALMHANNTLNHQPPTTWVCYNKVASDAAGASNLSMGVTASDAIDAFMIDAGNSNGAVGHRRWLLYPKASTFGHGSTSQFSAIHCLHNTKNTQKAAFEPEFVAYPPKGYIVQDLFRPNMRWSFSIPTADFSVTTVVIKDENGVLVSAPKEVLKPGYGENTLVFTPNIASLPLKDVKYSVTLANVKIAGVLKNYTYDVTWVKR